MTALAETEAYYRTLELGKYYINLVKVENFKSYYYENLNYFSKVAFNSYLKAVDIPPKFFKEQPEETQKELIDNRAIFVKEHKKYFDKVIVVARIKGDNSIVNACRMVESEALESYERLKTIDQISNKFEHRSFNKDGYISYIISNDIKNNEDNHVLAIDFPILLNKKAVIHEALYTLPNETFATPIEHIHYLSSSEVDFDLEYSDIKSAIDDKISFLTDEVARRVAEDILREPEVVALALNQAGIIPHSYIQKVAYYIKENSKGTLNTWKLESLVLDYDETFKGYKQITALRSINGHAILDILNSDNFKEFVEEMEDTIKELIDMK